MTQQSIPQLSEPMPSTGRGIVYLVGAGPGDPGLITVRGAKLLESADVVVYDYLSNPELLRHCPKAEAIYVGKKAASHSMTQDQINALLVEHGRAGRRVVRRKGGDPFVFGRGGEECEALTAAGIPFEVVPGVSSAIAAPAAAGIPVTMRNQASAFTVVTGHVDPAGTSTVDWEAHAATSATLVILMGVGHIASIAKRLM